MQHSGTTERCRLICWAIGVIAGITAFWVTWAPVSLIAALLLGLAITVFLGLVLNNLFCIGVEANSVTEPAVQTDEAAPVAADVEAESRAQAAEDAAVAAKTEADAKVAAKAEVEAKAATEVKAATKKAKADKAKAASGTANEGEGVKPAGLEAPRDGKADDLKQIKGIGPKLEIQCNDMGFYHFDQIAAWGADEVAYMNANLKGFRGRVSRDTWVAQATLLASGGETEFSKRVEKGSVYNK